MTVIKASLTVQQAQWLILILDEVPLRTPANKRAAADVQEAIANGEVIEEESNGEQTKQVRPEVVPTDYEGEESESPTPIGVGGIPNGSSPSQP